VSGRRTKGEQKEGKKPGPAERAARKAADGKEWGPSTRKKSERGEETPKAKDAGGKDEKNGGNLIRPNDRKSCLENPITE